MIEVYHLWKCKHCKDFVKTYNGNGVSHCECGKSSWSKIAFKSPVIKGDVELYGQGEDIQCQKEDYKGDCCCECKSNLKMKQHPWHPHTNVGYVCAVFNDVDNTRLCQPNHEHGMCEMFTQAIKINDT